ncbi:MAG: DUF86 domain-containing protein [Parachlamydiales bacterium]|nr:DUF86 domain-containing protein [Parachlamydiales bacterium]
MDKDRVKLLLIKAMVGFRNIAVHDYKTVNIEIVKSIIEKRLDNFIAFSKLALSIK